MFKEKFETKDLILRKAEMSDLNAIYKNFWSSKETAKYMTWKPCENIEEAKRKLEKFIESQKTNMRYFVFDKNTNEVIGLAGVMEIGNGVFEDGGMGFGVNFVKKGYGTQILKVLFDYLKNELKAKKFICNCCTDNIPSKKLIEKFGFTYTHSEEGVRKWDGWHYVADFYELKF